MPHLILLVEWSLIFQHCVYATSFLSMFCWSCCHQPFLLPCSSMHELSITRINAVFFSKKNQCCMICDGCHAPSDLRLIDIFAVRTLSKTHIWPGSAARAHHPPDCHLRRDAIPVFAGDVSPVTATPAMAGWAGLQLAGKCVVSLTKACTAPYLFIFFNDFIFNF